MSTLLAYTRHGQLAGTLVLQVRTVVPLAIEQMRDQTELDGPYDGRWQSRMAQYTDRLLCR